MAKINIEIPFFPGFYESHLYNSDSLYCEVNDNLDEYKDRFEDDTLTANDLDLDFDEYKKDCCKSFVDAFYDMSPDFVKGAEFAEMSSPKYYNFETDKVYANVEFEDDWKEKILSFMDVNKDWLTERIREDWSDRDGFWSFLDNRFQYWYEMFQEENDDDVDTRYISTMIAYILLKGNEEIRWDLCEYVLNEIFIGSYIINTKEENTAD